MTDTTKRTRPSWGEPGSKVTRATRATVFSAGIRPVIVTLYPDGMIGLRLSRSRREETLLASDAYKRAVVERITYERAMKRKAKKGAKA